MFPCDYPHFFSYVSIILFEEVALHGEAKRDEKKEGRVNKIIYIVDTLIRPKTKLVELSVYFD